MTAGTARETSIEADPSLPTVRVIREFDAPPDRVFRAWTDPALVARWLGPRGIEMRMQEWNAVTGGSYRYSAWQDGQQLARFYGSFHEVRPDERLVQTFTYVDVPDGVSLDVMTFQDLGGGRTRVVALSVVDSLEARDMMLSSGMDVGVIEGYQKLDEILAAG